MIEKPPGVDPFIVCDCCRIPGRLRFKNGYLEMWNKNSGKRVHLCDECYLRLQRAMRAEIKVIRGTETEPIHP